MNTTATPDLTAITTRPHRRALCGAVEPVAPERSLAQRMGALERANEIRSLRATLKRDLKAGRKPLLPLLVNPPDYLETAKTIDLLLAIPKIGRVKANQVLSKCRVSPSKTVGGLTQRQRNEIAEFMTVRSWN